MAGESKTSDSYNVSASTPVNGIFSGHSLYCLLEIIVNGASGDVKKELESVLNGKSYLKHDKLEALLVKCMIFHNDQLQLTDHYSNYALKHDIIMEPIDMNNLERSIDLVNKKVARFTNNLVDRPLNGSDYNESFRLTLMNVIYFKGQWAEQFEPELTRDDIFWNNERMQQSTVQMMNQYHNHFRYYEDESGQYILLPYEQWPYSMMICLPRSKINLNTNCFEIYSKMNRRLVGRLALPKFEIKQEIDLIPICKSMGIVSMFKESDQLKNMINGNDLMISVMKQQCVIKVNEEGTEAAAASYAEVMAGCCPPGEPEVPVDFIADHPFTIHLIDTQKSLELFTGSFFNRDAVEKTNKRKIES